MLFEKQSGKTDYHSGNRDQKFRVPVCRIIFCPCRYNCNGKCDMHRWADSGIRIDAVKQAEKPDKEVQK